MLPYQETNISKSIHFILLDTSLTGNEYMTQSYDLITYSQKLAFNLLGIPLTRNKYMTSHSDFITSMRLENPKFAGYSLNREPINVISSSNFVTYSQCFLATKYLLDISLTGNKYFQNIYFILLDTSLTGNE